MIADAVYNLRKSLRDRKLADDSTCKCKNHKDAFALRRALTCAREDGQKYDKPICANNLCRDCRDLGKLTSLMCEAEWAHVKDDTALTAEIWSDVSIYTKDRRTLKKKDFVKKQITWKKFKEYVVNFWPKFQAPFKFTYLLVFFG